MDDDLARRDGLPPDLLTLLDSLPRSGWADTPGFEGLAAFWLDRHLAFRRMLDMLAADARDVAEGRMDPGQWRPRLIRLGGHLVQDLQGHHQIEDEAYFPQMQRLEPRLQRGFDLLDRDHHALDGLLRGFVDAANGALQAADARAAAGRMAAHLAPFARQLLRHLEDEEDLIIPVVLKHRMR
jgi:hemerythrin-like domain-containing protein